MKKIKRDIKYLWVQDKFNDKVVRLRVDMNQIGELEGFLRFLGYKLNYCEYMLMDNAVFDEVDTIL
jgi:hypothetical protein